MRPASEVCSPLAGPAVFSKTRRAHSTACFREATHANGPGLPHVAAARSRCMWLSIIPGSPPMPLRSSPAGIRNPPNWGVSLWWPFATICRTRNRHLPARSMNARHRGESYRSRVPRSAAGCCALQHTPPTRNPIGSSAAVIATAYILLKPFRAFVTEATHPACRQP